MIHALRSWLYIDMTEGEPPTNLNPPTSTTQSTTTTSTTTASTSTLPQHVPVFKLPPPPTTSVLSGSRGSGGATLETDYPVNTSRHQDTTINHNADTTTNTQNNNSAANESDMSSQPPAQTQPGAIESISFACGGWLFIYMVGVAKAMQESSLLAEDTDLKTLQYLGCSAGGLCAAGLALDGDFEAAKQFCKERCVTRAYASLGGIFRIGEYVTECLEVAVDLKKVTSIARGRLQIQFTKLPFLEGTLAQEYTSPEDVQKCLLSSAAAFPFAPLVHHRGQWNVDGGFSAFQPIIDEKTITVSPLYFMNTDIKPSRYVPLWWALFPPNCPKTVDWLFDLGYNDGVNWIHERNKKQKLNNNEPSTAQTQARSRDESFHPFDVPRQISMHRFLGFDVADLTHSSVSMFMDFLLYLLLLLVWKPFAITMIYMELFVKVILLVSASVFYEVYDLLPLLLVGYALLAPHTTLLLWMFAFAALIKLVVVGPASGSHVGDLWDCVRCIGSVSLLRRYIPTSLWNLSAAPLKKHVHLNKSSLVYRIVRHFV